MTQYSTPELARRFADGLTLSTEEWSHLLDGVADHFDSALRGLPEGQREAIRCDLAEVKGIADAIQARLTPLDTSHARPYLVDYNYQHALEREAERLEELR